VISTVAFTLCHCVFHFMRLSTTAGPGLYAVRDVNEIGSLEHKCMQVCVGHLTKL
jgi:hypothetical protein